MTVRGRSDEGRSSSATGRTLLVALLVGLLLPAGPVTARPLTVVTVAGELSGEAGVVHLGVNARGPAGALSGGGGSSHVTFRVPATFTLTGQVAADVVTLRGQVAQSPLDYLVGTPITIVADAGDDHIALQFGPVSGGPLDGVTLRFSGTGQVHVT